MVPVGRLVETPAEIVAALDQYLAVHGRIDPTTALSSGYDFLSDGAAAVGSVAEVTIAI